MHKIPANLENPIDNSLYTVVELVAPTFYSLGFTPNMITTLGNICTIIAIYFFLQHNYKMSAVFFFLSYFFDCLDGYIARSYNMVSEFGDFYDHISDAIKFLSFVLLFLINNRKLAFKYIPVMILLILLMGFHLANQEIYYDNQASSKTLQIFNTLTTSTTKEEAAEIMKYSRFFGCGTVILFVTAIIAYSKKGNKIDRLF